jgi:RNA polymerase sigma-70 factor (ECF subfamily)
MLAPQKREVRLHWRGNSSTGLDVNAETDQTRFAEVFMPHLADAFRLARWLTGSRADAEDIVQEASLRAFKAIRGFGGSNARAWVLTIVRNTSYTWLAKNRPSAIVLRSDLDEKTREDVDQIADDARHTPEASLIAKLEADEIRQAVADLPPQFREVLVLREIHELDYRTIADVVQIPIGTVMSRLARARRLVLASFREGMQ